MTNTYVPFSYYKITKLQNYKQKIEQEKMFAMEDPAPLQLTDIFEDIDVRLLIGCKRHSDIAVCVVYNQSKVSSPKKFRNT